MPEYFRKSYTAFPDPQFLHKARHTALREALDELIWDFRAQTGHMSSQTSLVELYEWAMAQEHKPTEGARPDGHEKAEVKFRGTWHPLPQAEPKGAPVSFNDE